MYVYEESIDLHRYIIHDGKSWFYFATSGIKKSFSWTTKNFSHFFYPSIIFSIIISIYSRKKTHFLNVFNIFSRELLMKKDIARFLFEQEF